MPKSHPALVRVIRSEKFNTDEDFRLIRMNSLDKQSKTNATLHKSLRSYLTLHHSGQLNLSLSD